jgi:hypothetical protein
MLKLTIITLFISTALFAQTENDLNSTATLPTESFLEKMKSRLGMNYMSFFDGPGLLNDDQSFTPNAIGNPSDDGLVLMNNFSFKYKVKDDLAVDFQARFHWVMNNANDVEDFEPLRWQSPRLGISTTFYKTETSKFSGALNTDLPYFFPEPLGGGYIAERRTTLLTPGFFAKYVYTPVGSRWSLFSLVQPRFYIYEDRNVAEPQLSRAGYSPRLKNEFTFSVSPSVNYAFTDRFGTRLGTEIIYKKLVVSDWNPFNGTSKSADPNSKAWRLQPMPLQLGFTYIFSKMFELSTYIQGYPISSQRLNKQGEKTTFEDTVSAGAWISGTLF